MAKNIMSKALSHQSTVYQILRERVLDGVYGEDGKLPSLRELAQEFKISPCTVRLALLRLEQDELLKAQNGVGYFIRSRKPVQRILLLESAIQEHLFSRFFQAIQAKVAAEPSILLQVESLDCCYQPEGADPSSVLAKFDFILANGLDACFFDGEKVWGITPEQFKAYASKTRMFYYMSGYPAFLQTGIPGVSVDWHIAGYMVAHHLLEIGCRNILCEFTPDTAFRQGVKDALEVSNHNVKLHFTDPRTSLTNSEAGALFRTKQIEGYITCSDSLVIQHLDFFKECGYTLEGDLATVGCYNTPWATEFGFQLTSLDIKPEEQIELVWQMFTDKYLPSQITLPPALVKRASTQNFKLRN
ncbi:MAG: GntR family transcriptional regulator [Oligosphaeraceae bacterium]|nr:GntR family transcriptional regulator [Oligosphaeraceae bacterium]